MLRKRLQGDLQWRRSDDFACIWLCDGVLRSEVQVAVAKQTRRKWLLGGRLQRSRGRSVRASQADAPRARAAFPSEQHHALHFALCMGPSQSTATLSLRRLTNSYHAILHDADHMRSIRRPHATVKHTSPSRSAVRPVLFAEPISLQIT